MTIEVDRGAYEAITPWDSPEWRQSADEWISTRLDEQGIRAVDDGIRAVRVRPWSIVVRVPTSAGDVWFKANAAASRFEAGLSEALGLWSPGNVLAPLAVDRARGWFLSADGGTTFSAALDANPDASFRDWIAPLRQYAGLQRDVAGHHGELIALGVPDRRPAVLPGALSAMVEENTAIGDGERAALRALQPEFADWCLELQSLGIPDSLDHGDLHARQILGPDAEGRFRVFDWGDAAVAHPFTSLLVNARAVRTRFGSDADLDVLHDAYLEAWSGDGVAEAELRRGVWLAYRAGAVSRALVWCRVYDGRDEGFVASRDGYVARCLRWLLDPDDVFEL
jgi:hypothetical protein